MKTERVYCAPQRL